MLVDAETLLEEFHGLVEFTSLLEDDGEVVECRCNGSAFLSKHLFADLERLQIEQERVFVVCVGAVGEGEVKEGRGMSLTLFPKLCPRFCGLSFELLDELLGHLILCVFLGVSPLPLSSLVLFGCFTHATLWWAEGKGRVVLWGMWTTTKGEGKKWKRKEDQHGINLSSSHPSTTIRNEGDQHGINLSSSHPSIITKNEGDQHGINLSSSHPSINIKNEGDQHEINLSITIIEDGSRSGQKVRSFGVGHGGKIELIAILKHKRGVIQEHFVLLNAGVNLTLADEDDEIHKVEAGRRGAHKHEAEGQRTREKVPVPKARRTRDRSNDVPVDLCLFLAQGFVFFDRFCWFDCLID